MAIEHKLRWRLALVLISCLISALAGEAGLRVFFHDASDQERGLIYRYDAELGWFPRENARGSVMASRTISFANNSSGFRDREHARSDKPAVMVLGDSFVWGYDVEAGERFTDKLQANHPEWSVYNCGVSGYGTDQECLLLKKRFEEFKPAVVLLIFSLNDDADNCRNIAPGGFYKPYYSIESGSMELRGVPVPRSERAFCADHATLCRSRLVRLLARAYYKLVNPPPAENANPTGAILRNMQLFAQYRGAILVVGLEGPHPQLTDLKSFMEHCQIPYIDLSTDLRYPRFGNHWTPEGHTFVAQKVEPAISAVLTGIPIGRPAGNGTTGSQ